MADETSRSRVDKKMEERSFFFINTSGKITGVEEPRTLRFVLPWMPYAVEVK